MNPVIEATVVQIGTFRALVERHSHKIVIWKIEDDDEATKPEEVTTTDDHFEVGELFEQLNLCLDKNKH